MEFVLAGLVLSTFGLLTAANQLDRGLAVCLLGLVSAPVLWRVTRWTTSLILLEVSIAILDHTLPNRRREWRRAMPGVAFVVLGWLVSTAGFNLYAQYLGTFNGTYGVLGVFVFLMVWIYLSSLIILTGADINSVLRTITTGSSAMAPNGVAIEPPARSSMGLRSSHGS